MKAKGDLEKLKEGRNRSFANEISTETLFVCFSKVVKLNDNNMERKLNLLLPVWYQRKCEGKEMV